MEFSTNSLRGFEGGLQPHLAEYENGSLILNDT